MLLIACSGNKGKPASNILQTEKMIPVLEDIHLAEAYVFNQHMNTNLSTKWLSYYYHVIYRIHQIDSAQFSQSLAYYESNPEKLLDIYDKLLTDMSIRQEAISEALYDTIN